MAPEKDKTLSSRLSGVEEETASNDGVIQDGSIENFDTGVDKEKEKKLLRKTDIHIFPIMMLLYTFSFLDRVNIGNAKLYSLEEDLGLTGNQYQIAVSILFVTYCISEVPSTLIIKKVKPNRFIGFIAVTWGIVATLTGVVQSYGGLIATRLIMGLFEGGLFPGFITYLTMFYSREQLALRVGYLFVTAAVAGVLGGLISYGVGYMDGLAGMRAWRWLMIIEGLPPVFGGIAAYFFLAESPATAKFLSPEERELMGEIRRREAGHTASAQEFHWKDVKEGVMDWNVWMFGTAQFFNDIMLYGFSTFLPTIIKGIGTWTAPQAQALTIPIYALGSIVYLVIAYISDRQQQRGLYASACAFISAIGYCMLIAGSSSAVSYTGCFVIATGLYVSVGLPIAWLPGNKPRYGKRSFAIGAQATMGNISGIVVPFLFENKDAPRYLKGYGFSIVSLCIASSIFCGMSFYWRGVNKRRKEGREDWKLEGKSEEEILEMGDRSPRYVFAL